MSKSAKTLKTNKKSIREVRYKTAKFPKSTSSHYKTAKSANSAKSSSIKFATLTALRHAKGVVTQETWDRILETGDVRQVTWDRRHKTEGLETGKVRQDTEDVRQETWDRRYETGDIRREIEAWRQWTGGWTGDRRLETGYERRKSGDGTGDRKQETWEMRHEWDRRLETILDIIFRKFSAFYLACEFYQFLKNTNWYLKIEISCSQMRLNQNKKLITSSIL